jgi:hypothetical protein
MAILTNLPLSEWFVIVLPKLVVVCFVSCFPLGVVVPLVVVNVSVDISKRMLKNN